MDEDTCATNFMAREGPLRGVGRVERARGGQLVAYLAVADTVLLMDLLLPWDITAQARALLAAESQRTATDQLCMGEFNKLHSTT